MKFHRSRAGDEPEINLIPFIDVLLVVLIFLMLSTTYSKFTELQIKLPVADTNPQREHPQEVIVAVASDRRVSVNKTPVPSPTVQAIASALTLAAQGHSNTVVIISADAQAPHQTVISVMEAARSAGLAQITFATQSAASPS